MYHYYNFKYYIVFKKQQVPRLTELLEEEIVLKKLDHNTELAENQSKSGSRASNRLNWNILFKVLYFGTQLFLI